MDIEVIVLKNELKKFIVDYEFHPDVVPVAGGKIKVNGEIIKNHDYFNFPKQANIISSKICECKTPMDRNRFLSKIAYTGRFEKGGYLFSKSVRKAVEVFIFERRWL